MSRIQPFTNGKTQMKAQSSCQSILQLVSQLMGRFMSGTRSLRVSKLLLALLLSMMSLSSFAAIDVYDFKDEQQEAQYRRLIDEFRCPKCQNQNLAGSDAPIAQDLKQKITIWSKKAGQMMRLELICSNAMATLLAISHPFALRLGCFGFFHRCY